MPWADWSSTLPWKDIITIAAASVGAVLGIMNTANAMSQRRVRVRVTPAYVTTPEKSPLGFSIEVINLSTFPITVAEVGFAVGRKSRAPVQRPQFLDGKSLPRRLEPREAISAMLGPADFPMGIKVGDAYARTACGRTIYGSSPAGRQFSKMLDEIAAAR
jgi:hypothetical protein